MAGLTESGLKARIVNKVLSVTEAEGLDLFFMYPTLVDIQWVKGDMDSVKVRGMNLDFSIRS